MKLLKLPHKLVQQLFLYFHKQDEHTNHMFTFFSVLMSLNIHEEDVQLYDDINI